MKSLTNNVTKQIGLVLIELLVALAILAILATFSYFGYQQYGLKKDISNGQQYLLELQQKQGLYYLNHRRYARNSEELEMPAAPVGSEKQFEPIKIFSVTGEEINLSGGDFYTAVLDVKENRHPPLVASENGARWFEYDDNCYDLARIGSNSAPLNLDSMTAIDKLRILAKCGFDKADRRWDENAGGKEKKGGSPPQNDFHTNPVAVFYNSLPSEKTGEPPTSLPSESPFCDANQKNKTNTAGAFKNFTVEGYLQSCSCSKDSAILEFSATTNRVQCRRYTACGIEVGTYVEEIVPANCNEIFKCDTVTNQVNGATDANVKTDVIYADPDNSGYENGYRVWCSARGILTVDFNDPTKSTCYAATCKDDGKIGLDENNNLAQYELVFNCSASIANSFPSSEFVIRETTTGNRYRVSCPIGTEMTAVKNDNFRDSTCSSYLCERGKIKDGETNQAGVQ